MSKICLILSLSFICLHSHAAYDNNPEELGKVEWIRNLAQAQQIAAEQKKPILILFQEIPGCSTCKRYGNEVLSHPLLVEAIESLFVPLAIYNNRKGKDESVLAYYQEPSWNNPVVRIVNADKKNVLPRLNGNYTPAGLSGYMIHALEKINMPVPTYLTLINEELSARETGIEKITLSMYCFWTGERELGKLDGVVHTEAGFMDGREVVNVFYDPNEIRLEEVIKKGSATRCADRIYASDEVQAKQAKKIAATKSVSTAKTFRLDREPKYYLSKTIYQYLPMSPMQAVKANVLVGQGKKPIDLFSPRQMAMVEYLMEAVKKQSAIHNDDWKNLFFELLAKTNLRT